MSDSTWYIRQIQELEYLESLRNDIEKDILSEEIALENSEKKRVNIERELIEEAEYLDEKMEKCSLSPNSLRMKRLAFFGVNNETNSATKKNSVFKKRCGGKTKKGKKCLNYTYDDFCFIHRNKQ